jgi:hypothetical protein
MKKVYRLIFSSAVILGMTTTGIQAQNKPTENNNNSMVDLKSITCRSLLKLDDSDKEATMIFFHGYMSGKKGESMINVPNLAEISDQIIDHCINQPDETLLNMFEKHKS